MEARELTYTKCLVDKIKIIKDCTDYNFCNILKGVPDDPKWLSNRMRLQKCEDTILGIYLNNIHIKHKLDKPGYNPGILKRSIQQYISKYKPPLPGDDEVCMYIRLGDQNLANFDYISAIERCNERIITIVCCIAFSSGPVTEWHYSNNRVDESKKIISDLISELHERFFDRTINVMSNDNPDLDICYLFKNGFISHPKCSWKQIFGNF